MAWLWVGLGGFVGAVLRFGISSWMHARIGGAWPLGTLTVNVLGCLAIGALLGIARHPGVLSPEWRPFLIVGLLGSFTTFSTFGHEALTLLQLGAAGRALAWVGLHLVLGLGAVWVGAEGIRRLL